MNISYAENGWTTFINEDLNTMSVNDIKEVARLTVENTVTVFRNQNLTPEKQLEICEVMGKCQKVTDNRIMSISVIPGVLRVTGQKNEEGVPGLFGHKRDLDWHANQPSNKERKPFIWLYGAEGTKGSKTSWINMIEAYNDLSEDFKEEIKDIKVYCGYKQGSYSDSPFFVEHINKDNPINLVHTNDAGKVGLFFPFLQIFEFEGEANNKFDDLMNRLKDHVLQEKYAYHHYWEDGDVVLAEQWLGIHKRWYFEDMDKRILHRIALDYSNVYN